MRTLSILTGAAVFAASLVVSTADAASASPRFANVTYCETFVTSGTVHGGGTTRRSLTLVSRSDGHEFLVQNMTMGNTPVAGERLLIESPVVKGRPRIMDCRVRSINGVPAMILTTFGGAEHAILDPIVGR